MLFKTRVILTAFLLTACANTFSNPTSIAKLKADSNTKKPTGTIIFSAGSPKGCLGTQLNLQLFQENEANAGKSSIFAKQYYLSNHAAKTDYETHHGFIHAAKVSPGSYYFFPTSYGKVTSGYEARFTIDEGETVYLGEYFIEDVCKLNVNATWTTQVNDKSIRDIAKIRKLNPEIDTSKIEVRIMNISDKLTGN